MRDWDYKIQSTYTKVCSTFVVKTYLTVSYFVTIVWTITFWTIHQLFYIIHRFKGVQWVHIFWKACTDVFLLPMELNILFCWKLACLLCNTFESLQTACCAFLAPNFCKIRIIIWQTSTKIKHVIGPTFQQTAPSRVFPETGWGPNNWSSFWLLYSVVIL